MINSTFRDYDYCLYGALDEYGQQTIIKDDSGAPAVQGSIKIAIYPITTAIQANINYTDSSYTGLTHDKQINDTYVIKYNDELLKVLYVMPIGRLKQAYFKKI